VPSDPAIQQAREHHRRAAEALALAERHRQQRDALIRRAREDEATSLEVVYEMATSRSISI
jgi:hypothetical protein